MAFFSPLLRKHHRKQANSQVDRTLSAENLGVAFRKVCRATQWIRMQCTLNATHQGSFCCRFCRETSLQHLGIQCRGYSLKIIFVARMDLEGFFLFLSRLLNAERSVLSKHLCQVAQESSKSQGASKKEGGREKWGCMWRHHHSILQDLRGAMLLVEKCILSGLSLVLDSEGHDH